jgi:hypothetical protein
MANISEIAPLGIGGPTTSAWREEMLTRAEELSSLAAWIRDHPEHSGSVAMAAAIERHLAAARETAEGTNAKRLKRAWQAVKGSSFERTLGNLDAVEVSLLRLAPTPVLKGALPSVQAHVNRFLPKDDPRRQAVDDVAADGSASIGDDQRDMIVAAQHAANTQRRRDLLRLRAFRNLLVGGILVFTLIALGLATVGANDPTALPLCFSPEAQGRVTIVCPREENPIGPVPTSYDRDQDVALTVTPEDVRLIELMGLLGAALASGAALRKLKGTSTPYAVPISLMILKLPTGAVTAVVGLLLMRAEFVPGLSALDSSAQILGWAVVFGISQQLVTRFADSQATGLLENVGGRGPAGDRPMPDDAKVG